MNQFFDDKPDYRFEPPQAVFARFEQSEPVDLRDAEDAVVAFEAVDANWLLRWERFDYKRPGALETHWAAYWKDLGRSSPVESDAFADIPIYRFEFTTPRGGPFFDEVEKFETDPRWFLFIRDDHGLPMDVFGNLFAAPVTAQYNVSLAPDEVAPGLDTVFDMGVWPDASEADIRAAASAARSSDFLGVFDIGQGSASALLDGSRQPELYFDLGCGVYRNANTSPTPLRFCWTNRPPVVLSHWDADHWAGGLKDPSALPRTWVAPRQSIGPVHAGFANSIVQAGGRVLIWGNAQQSVTTRSGPRQVTVSRCLGTGRNGSGLVLTAEDQRTNQSWLLTGDAGYHELSIALPSNLSAVVIPHHGATMNHKSVPPAPGGSIGNRRLLYSFGSGNKHGRTAVQHPTAQAVALHHSHGWNQGAWRAATIPGNVVAGGDVVSTATHPNGRLGGVIVSWIGPPNPSPTPCGAILGQPQSCSISLDQS